MSPGRDRSPTIEEQKSLNMAESLNARALEADGQNSNEGNWYELRTKTAPPSRRAHHSSFVYQERLYIFGGNDIRIGALNNLYSFDMRAIGNLPDFQSKNGSPTLGHHPDEQEELEWKPVQTHGSLPGPISHHKSIVHGKNMYVIGGVMCGRDYNCSQIYRLDLQSLNWDVVKTKRTAEENAPSSLDEHSAELDGSKVVIFGGFEDGTRVNHIHVFNVETLTWDRISPANPKAKAPKPRAGHTANLYNNGASLFVFGGKDDENMKLNDLWRFDFASKEWTELHPTTTTFGKTPQIRSGHTAVIQDNYLCIFGGIFEVTKERNDFHLYDIKRNSWIEIFGEKIQDVADQSPTKTMAMGAVSPLMRRTKREATSPAQKQSHTVGMERGMTGEMQQRRINEQKAKLHKPSGEENKKCHKEINLDSPTSTDMKRSLLIASADPSFDMMAQLKKKKNTYGFGATYNSFGLNMAFSQKGKMRVCGIRPNPREGHIGINYNGYMIVFGGDRHHMPFNDLFALDMKAEFERQSYLFEDDNNSDQNDRVSENPLSAADPAQ